MQAAPARPNPSSWWQHCCTSYARRAVQRMQRVHPNRILICPRQEQSVMKAAVENFTTVSAVDGGVARRPPGALICSHVRRLVRKEVQARSRSTRYVDVQPDVLSPAQLALRSAPSRAENSLPPLLTCMVARTSLGAHHWPPCCTSKHAPSLTHVTSQYGSH